MALQNALDHANRMLETRDRDIRAWRERTSIRETRTHRTVENSVGGLERRVLEASDDRSRSGKPRDPARVGRTVQRSRIGLETYPSSESESDAVADCTTNVQDSSLRAHVSSLTSVACPKNLTPDTITTIDTTNHTYVPPVAHDVDGRALRPRRGMRISPRATN